MNLATAPIADCENASTCAQVRTPGVTVSVSADGKRAAITIKDPAADPPSTSVSVTVGPVHPPPSPPAPAPSTGPVPRPTPDPPPIITAAVAAAAPLRQAAEGEGGTATGAIGALPVARPPNAPAPVPAVGVPAAAPPSRTSTAAAEAGAAPTVFEAPRLLASALAPLAAWPDSLLLISSLLLLALLAFVVAGDRRLADRAARADLAAALGIGVDELPPMRASIGQALLLAVQPVLDRSVRMSQMVMYDDLTGLYRRGAGMELLAREVSRADRALVGRLAVAFVDVVGLKTINDTQGHAAGDALLKGVGQAIAQRLRANDVAIRLGGDEFVCVLVNVDLALATQIMRDVAAAVAARTGREAISFGIATYRRGDSAEALVERADSALYAKRRVR